MKITRSGVIVSITNGIELRVRNCHTIAVARAFETALRADPEGGGRVAFYWKTTQAEKTES